MSILFHYFVSVRWLALFYFSFFFQNDFYHIFDTFIILKSLDLVFIWLFYKLHFIRVCLYACFLLFTFSVFTQPLDQGQCQPDY